jgi:hypothetical protein
LASGGLSRRHFSQITAVSPVNAESTGLSGKVDHAGFAQGAAIER